MKRSIGTNEHHRLQDARALKLASEVGDQSAPAEPCDAGRPDWVHGAGEWTAFTHGLRLFIEIPALILAATGAGFGALAHDAGLEFGPTAVMSIVIYATPAQVVLVDHFARGASVMGGAIAISLTAIRFLPMTVSLMPYLRGPQARRWQYVMAAHFIAVTGWNEANRRLPVLPESLRLAHFLGIGTALCSALLVGTVIGFLLAGLVPPMVSAALLFMTPLYFIMSLIMGARQAVDWVALGAGIVLGPVLFIALPGFDLLLTGLVGGSLAFLVGGRPPVAKELGQRS